MSGLLNWLAELLGFGSDRFPFSAQVRFVGGLSALTFVAVVVIGTYVFFRKSFGGLEDFDGPAAGAFAAVAGAGALVFASLLLASRRGG